MTDNNEALLKSFGALNYDIDRICAILCNTSEDEKAMRDEWANPNSNLRRLFQKGYSEAEYRIDVMLFEAASAGDIRSLNELEKRKSIREREEKRKNKRNGKT
jgi:hypothetical protein